MTHNDDFDQVLDDALAEYRDAEPLAGLEDRVLQRLQLQAERRRNVWWRWSAIAAAAAALAVPAWIGWGDRTQHVSAPSVVGKRMPPIEGRSPQAEAHATRQLPVIKRTPVARTASPHVPIVVATQLSNKHLPMRGQFPSPAPLKPEERMLLALAKTHPEILLDKPDDEKEIVIAPINIKPLVDETAGSQGEN
jgi:hypothetical protein